MPEILRKIPKQLKIYIVLLTFVELANTGARIIDIFKSPILIDRIIGVYASLSIPLIIYIYKSCKRNSRHTQTFCWLGFFHFMFNTIVGIVYSFNNYVLTKNGVPIEGFDELTLALSRSGAIIFFCASIYWLQYLLVSPDSKKFFSANETIRETKPATINDKVYNR